MSENLLTTTENVYSKQTSSFHFLFTSSNDNTRKSMNYGLSNVVSVDEFTSTRAEISIESSQSKKYEKETTQSNFKLEQFRYMRILICSQVNNNFW